MSADCWELLSLPALKLSVYVKRRASQWSDIQRGVGRGSWEEGLKPWRGVCSAEGLFSGRLLHFGTSSASFLPKPLRVDGRKTRALPRICRQTSLKVAAFLRRSHAYIVNVNTGSSEDPGRTRSTGYQVIRRACTSDGPIRRVKQVVRLSSSYWLKSNERKEDEGAEEEEAVRGNWRVVRFRR